MYLVYTGFDSYIYINARQHLQALQFLDFMIYFTPYLFSVHLPVYVYSLFLLLKRQSIITVGLAWVVPSLRGLLVRLFNESVDWNLLSERGTEETWNVLLVSLSYCWYHWCVFGLSYLNILDQRRKSLISYTVVFSV